jgi:hypothetical protein
MEVFHGHVVDLESRLARGLEGYAGTSQARRVWCFRIWGEAGSVAFGTWGKRGVRAEVFGVRC